MTAKELKQIYFLNKEIKMWQKELERIQFQSLAKAQEITGMPSAGGVPDKVSDMAVAICDIETVIKGKLSEVQIARKSIMEYIDAIDDSYMRQVVYLRNVSCMEWGKIAKEVGGSGDSHRKAYERFLKSNIVKK